MLAFSTRKLVLRGRWMKILDENRLFPADGEARSHRRQTLRDSQRSPHHLPARPHRPALVRLQRALPQSSRLLIQPDHYIFRMLYSQGVSLESLGIPQLDGNENADPREVWRIFAKNYYLFRGTPTRLWLDYALENQFGLNKRLERQTTPTSTTTSSQTRSKPPPSARARSSRNSTSKSSPPPTPPSTPSSTTKPSATPDGRAASSPPSVPTPSSTPTTPASSATSTKLGEITGEDIGTCEGLPQRPAQPPRLLQVHGLHLHRPRPPHRPDRRPRPRHRSLTLRPHPLRPLRPRRAGDLPRPDAHRDGRHERRRRPHHAAPSRLRPQSQSPSLRKIRPRQRRRHSLAHRVRPRPAPPALQIRQRRPTSPSSSSPSTRPPSPANSPRSPDTIPRSSSARPGGSTTRPKA